MTEGKSIFKLATTWAKGSNIELWSEESVGSTNSVAKEEALSLISEFKLYITAEQSAGRGRGEHRWISPERGSALLSSWSYKLPQAPQHLSGPLFGLALYQAAAQTWPNLPFSLKAPNDLFLNGKKVAGLLLETVSQGGEHRLIVGLGFNGYADPIGIDDATHLDAFTLEDHDHSDWTEFLTVLQATFGIAADHCIKNTLDDESRRELLEALNKNPNLTEPYTDISPKADLITASKQQNWGEL